MRTPCELLALLTRLHGFTALALELVTLPTGPEWWFLSWWEELSASLLCNGCAALTLVAARTGEFSNTYVAPF
jgi:hypothetical protein